MGNSLLDLWIDLSSTPDVVLTSFFCHALIKICWSHWEHNNLQLLMKPKNDSILIPLSKSVRTSLFTITNMSELLSELKINTRFQDCSLCLYYHIFDGLFILRRNRKMCIFSLNGKYHSLIPSAALTWQGKKDFPCFICFNIPFKYYTTMRFCLHGSY